MYQAFLMVLSKSDDPITQKNETGPPPRLNDECINGFEHDVAKMMTVSHKKMKRDPPPTSVFFECMKRFQ